MTKLLQEFSKWLKKVTGYEESTGELGSDPKAEVQLAQPIKTEARSPLIQKKRGKVNIQVGLDFGTSATKIMYSQLGRRGIRL